MTFTELINHLQNKLAIHPKGREKEVYFSCTGVSGFKFVPFESAYKSKKQIRIALFTPNETPQTKCENTN